MQSACSALMTYLVSRFRSHEALRLENMALRHQLAVYRHTVKRPKLRPSDRLFWVWLSRLWPGWQKALAFVQPRTVIAWQQKRFRDYWRQRSQCGMPGRPAISKEVRELIQDMWRSNPTWGSPRIVGELHKIGIDVAKSTVEKYRPKNRTPSSPTWKAFLHNHVTDIVACDFFTVPTVTFRVLFVFIILAHNRRRIVHFNVTKHPTAQWTAQQIVDAFPWETAPHYLLRDRDAIYSTAFQQRVKNMGIEEVKIAPRSPWQSPYVERLIGSMDQRAHLRRNIQFCITSCQIIVCTAIKQRAKITDLLLTARSGALLSYKLTRKPVQKIKIRLMQDETVPFCLNAPAGPLSSSFDHQDEIDLLKHQKTIVWSVSPYLRRKLGPVLTVIR